MKDKKDLNKATGISMPPSLKEKLKKKAKEDNRSFSQYCCMILEKHA